MDEPTVHIITSLPLYNFGAYPFWAVLAQADNPFNSVAMLKTIFSSNEQATQYLREMIGTTSPMGYLNGQHFLTLNTPRSLYAHDGKYIGDGYQFLTVDHTERTFWIQAVPWEIGSTEAERDFHHWLDAVGHEQAAANGAQTGNQQTDQSTNEPQPWNEQQAEQDDVAEEDPTNRWDQTSPQNNEGKQSSKEATTTTAPPVLSEEQETRLSSSGLFWPADQKATLLFLHLSRRRAENSILLLIRNWQNDWKLPFWV